MGLKVALACGGTGGHVFPALAVGKVLREEHGAELVVVGRPEENWARQGGFEFRRRESRAVAPLQDLEEPGPAFRGLPSTSGSGIGRRPSGVRHRRSARCCPAGIAAKRLGFRWWSTRPTAIPVWPTASWPAWPLGFSPALPPGLRGKSRASVGWPHPTRLAPSPGPLAQDRFLVVIGGSQGARGVNRMLAEEAARLGPRVGRSSEQQRRGSRMRARSPPPSRACAREPSRLDVYGAFGAADLALTRSAEPLATCSPRIAFGAGSLPVGDRKPPGNQRPRIRNPPGCWRSWCWNPSGSRAGHPFGLWQRREEAARAMLSLAGHAAPMIWPRPWSMRRSLREVGRSPSIASRSSIFTGIGGAGMAAWHAAARILSSAAPTVRNPPILRGFASWESCPRRTRSVVGHHPGDPHQRLWIIRKSPPPCRPGIPVVRRAVGEATRSSRSLCF